MKVLHAVKHIGIILIGAFLILGLPFLCTDYCRSLVNGAGSVDATSSASLVIDKPSGNYVILINRDYHKNKENLALWEQFFRGEEVSFIFEDIACSTAKGDAGGAEMARSFQSRLPENQMSIRAEDATLLMSRADHGKFDIIILSKEFADGYAAKTAYGENVEVISLADDQ